jgi:DNA polymerase III subunit epsilon
LFVCGGDVGIDFAAIDFETANNDRASICSAGMAIVVNGNLVDSKYWLVRPGNLFFHPFNVSIHGITADDVKDKPQFGEIWREMLPYLSGNVVLAHNASFDMGCIRAVLNEYCIEYPSFDYSCTRNLAKKAFPRLISYSLSAVTDYLSVDFSHHHAEQDAMACAAVALRMCDLCKSKSIYELAEHLDTTIGRIYPGSYSPARLHSWKRDGGFRIGDIAPTCSDYNIHHPFYKKQLVFTGALHSMARKDAMQEVVNVGGCCGSTVGANASFLVVGELDYRQLKDGLKSNKLKKADQLIAEGRDLELLTEDEFLNLLISH